MLAETRGTPLAKNNSHEVLAHARGATHEAIAIHSVRLPGLIAPIKKLFLAA